MDNDVYPYEKCNRKDARYNYIFHADDIQSLGGGYWIRISSYSKQTTTSFFFPRQKQTVYIDLCLFGKPQNQRKSWNDFHFFMVWN